MSERIYREHMGPRKSLVWLHGEVHTPPMTTKARVKTGMLLRRLQMGESLGMPESRPMPSVGAGCHELRVDDGRVTWRVVYGIDTVAVVVLDVFREDTSETPTAIIIACRDRLKRYERIKRESG
jgi:phage-related protein